MFLPVIAGCSFSPMYGVNSNSQLIMSEIYINDATDRNHQIIRNEIPEITNFFILHEGPLGVFDDQLVEKDYDDVVDKKYSINAEKGFLGITEVRPVGK